MGNKKHYQHTEHIEDLPFTIIGGIPSDVVFIIIGHQQYWKKPEGGWEVISYYAFSPKGIVDKVRG